MVGECFHLVEVLDVAGELGRGEGELLAGELRCGRDGQPGGKLA